MEKLDFLYLLVGIDNDVDFLEIMWVFFKYFSIGGFFEFVVY